MRFRVAAGLVFALLMFLIPLLALVGNVDMVQYSPREDASVPQASAPAGTGQAAPEKDPSAPAASSGTTPAVTVADDGFRILDDRTGKVFEVSARDYVRGALAAEMPPTRRAGRVTRPKSSSASGTAIWRTPTGRRSAARRTRRAPTCSPGRGNRSWRPTTR